MTSDLSTYSLDWPFFARIDWTAHPTPFQLGNQSLLSDSYCWRCTEGVRLVDITTIHDVSLSEILDNVLHGGWEIAGLDFTTPSQLLDQSVSITNVRYDYLWYDTTPVRRSYGYIRRQVFDRETRTIPHESFPLFHTSSICTTVLGTVAPKLEHSTSLPNSPHEALLAIPTQSNFDRRFDLILANWTSPSRNIQGFVLPTASSEDIYLGSPNTSTITYCLQSVLLLLPLLPLISLIRPLQFLLSRSFQPRQRPGTSRIHWRCVRRSYYHSSAAAIVTNIRCRLVEDVCTMTSWNIKWDH